MYTFIADVVSFYIFLYAYKIRSQIFEQETHEERVEKFKEAFICVVFGWIVFSIGHY
jgi:hypothetical protein